MLPVLFVVILAGLAAWGTYWRLERIGPRAWLAAVCRGVAWSALGLLLLDLSCARMHAGRGRPLVLLDGSLSMTGAGGRWAEALDSARLWGEIRLFGDPAGSTDTAPALGRSALAPALRAAAASDRPVLVVTDGELDDAAELTPELLPRAGVRLFPRARGRDLAVTRVDGPSRVTAGDTIRVEAEVRAWGPGQDSVRVEIRLDQRVLARQVVRLGPDGIVLVRFGVPSTALPAEALLRVGVADAADDEPRDDVRLYLVRVTPTPGVVLLATPADWDARFLFRALRDVAQLPVRGYTRIERDRWRNMEDLAPATLDEVSQAARRADVLIQKGASPEFARQTRARGIWDWPSGEGGETIIPGEWYVTASPTSPVAGALIGLPLDSFPPLIQITPIEPGAATWTGLSVQLGRRGTERPVFVGQASGGRRHVMTAGEGLWRWAFRGGSSEEGYRALVASTLSWLLGGTDSTTGPARAIRPVVENGRPVVFEWTGGGLPAPLGIVVSGVVSRRDTLRFGGEGRAMLRLPPGRYRYQLDGGGGGVVVVDEWSEEWLPRAVVLADRTVPAVTEASITSTRGWMWLFLVAILALGGEWMVRRRLGLR